ncbi:DNA polymerase III subunit [Nafulsella turpanensis]|uniref:DNA polymerase III subunit n=1 Tax=Nafulsella turpanensis TaxID=1265690 RepID=UPI000345C217|nr:DNA polymerase III subunit delta' [Nafulsella turpanensis]
MQFADIPGLEEVKTSLINSVKNNHLAHAQLFFGPEGSGNLAMALAFATYLNCTNRQMSLDGSEDACSQCPSCQKMSRFVHPDVHYVFPVSATKNISGKDVVSSSYLADWRNFLTGNPYGTISQWMLQYGGEDKQVNISKEESRHIVRNLSLKAFEGNYKVMIIWLPEYMHVSAANGILKILEEPPAKTIFLLVSSDVEKLLTTILSRTQIFKIRGFKDEEISRYLVQQHELPEEQAAKAARMANGSMSAALGSINEVKDNNHSLYSSWMRLCYERNFSQLIQMADDFHQLNKDAQKSLLLYGLNILRETLVYPYTSEELVRLEGDERMFVERFSKVMSWDKVQLIAEKLNESLYHLERNASPKIMFLDLSLQVAGIIKS